VCVRVRVCVHELIFSNAVACALDLLLMWDTLRAGSQHRKSTPLIVVFLLLLLLLHLCRRLGFSCRRFAALAPIGINSSEVPDNIVEQIVLAQVRNLRNEIVVGV
jgi:hypothetical protein